MKRPLKTLLYGYDKEQFLFPLGLWGLFVLMSVFFFEKERAASTAGAFLGYVMPLLSGILAAYALLGDSILELRFSTGHSSWRMLGERILMLFGFFALLAVSLQGIMAVAGIDLTRYGNLLQRQILWIAPCLMALGLGCVGSFLAGNAVTGAGIAGAVWVLQIFMRYWFSTNDVLQYIFLFQGMMYTPGSMALIRNQASLMLLFALFFIASGLLLRRQERYLK